MEKKNTIFFRLLLLIGIGIFFYPTISDYVNSINQSKAIIDYGHGLDEFERDRLEAIMKDAEDYNKRLSEEVDPINRPGLVEGYEDALNPFDNGMMGYVTIDKIKVDLPIYHGVTESVIQSGVGHLEGSSLPIGGEGNHGVISTHSGLPSSKLFTDLNKLEIGDEFSLTILNRELSYKVDQILKVLPNEIEALRPVEGKDYLTMFTCTPYGINTHRLLVRGIRIPNKPVKEENHVDNKVENKMRANVIKMIVILIILVLILGSIIKDLVILIKDRKHKL